VVNTLGFSILVPVFPFIAQEYHAGPLLYGFLMMVYSLCQFFAAPYLGALSDRYGRKKLLIITQV